MFNTFRNLKIKNCGTGISLPTGGGGDVYIDPEISDCDVGIEQRDPVDTISMIGLPPDTPHDIIIEVLKILKAHEKDDVPQKEALISRARIGALIQGTANSTSIIANLIAISSNPTVATFIAALKMGLPK